jgi:hypothetical protein
MRKQLLLMVAVGACFGLVGLRSTWGLEVDGQGTYTSQGGSTPNTWHGRFLVGGPRLEGSVTLSGRTDVQSADIQGSVAGAEINFTFNAGTPLPAFFTGKVTGNEVRGTYTLGSENGSWSGQWTLAPGLPAADGEPVQPLPAFVGRAPRQVLDSSFDANTRPAACELLQDPDALAAMSAAGQMSLSHACQPEVLPETVARLWRRVRDSLLDVLGFPSAQAQPANHLANDPTMDTYPHITQEEVAVGVSGRNQDIFVVGFNDYAGRFRDPHRGSGYARSVDHGSTWTDRGELAPPTTDGISGGDPAIASDSDGSFYFARMAQLTQSGANWIGVSKSTDDGWTFELPVNASPFVVNADKPDIAVDRTPTSPYFRRIYVCWTDFGVLAGVHFSRSTNAGTSFQQNGAILNTVGGNGGFFGCSIAAGPLGDVWVGWWTRGTDTQRINKIFVAHSGDGGVTFGDEMFLGDAQPPPTNPNCLGSEALAGGPPPPTPNPTTDRGIRIIPSANVATDPLQPNNVYVAWGHWEAAQQSNEIYFSATTDGGLSWSSPPKRINRVTTNDQFFPRIATNVYHGSTSDSTEILLVWYDRRLDPANLALDIFSNDSFDSGTTWSATDARWTSQSSPLPRLNPNFDCAIGAPCIFGDYIGLASRSPGTNTFVAGWTDTRPPLASGTPCLNNLDTSPDPNVMTAVGC